MIRVVFSLLLTSFWIVGTSSEAQSVAPLFQASGYLTNVAVPFEVKGVPGANDTISVVSLSPIANTGNCKSLIDLYRPQIFHVRCTRAGSVIYKVAFHRNGVLEAMTLPSITVTAPTGTVVDPDPGPGDPTTDPDIAVGQSLFNSHCITCHTATAMKGRSAAQISGAISSIPLMNSLSTLSTTQRNQISKYLRSL